MKNDIVVVVHVLEKAGDFVALVAVHLDQNLTEMNAGIQPRRVYLPLASLAINLEEINGASRMPQFLDGLLHRLEGPTSLRRIDERRVRKSPRMVGGIGRDGLGPKIPKIKRVDLAMGSNLAVDGLFKGKIPVRTDTVHETVGRWWLVRLFVVSRRL